MEPDVHVAAPGVYDIPPHPEVADLRERVAALEARLAPGYPLKPFGLPPLTEEQEAELKREFDETMRGPFTHQPPPPTPDQVRYLLRECVTIIEPGETLVIRGRNWTPNQVREIQQWMDAMHEDGTIGFKVLAVIGDELGVIEAGEEAGDGA